MELRLSGLSERLPELYREFCGKVRVQMPLLVSGKDKTGKIVDVPRVPASFAYILNRRMEAPLDVREAWQNNFFLTGDGSIAGTKGDHLIVLDVQPLRELTEESELYQGALVLPPGAWDELKLQKDKVLYLTAEEVREAENQGYINLKKEIWTPANKTVDKVWKTLSRGQDLTSYIQLVSVASEKSRYIECGTFYVIVDGDFARRNSFMKVHFNQTTKDGKPTMRSWWVGSVNHRSNASTDRLDFDTGRLVGVAQNGDPCRTKFKLEAVLEEFKLKDPAELRKALQLYSATKKL